MRALHVLLSRADEPLVCIDMNVHLSGSIKLAPFIDSQVRDYCQAALRSRRFSRDSHQSRELVSRAMELPDEMSR